ncbi:MAG: Imm32 family immunity protein [Chloracidobacterium sp.]
MIEKLTRLRRKQDHEHLMTPSWGGNELTEVKQGGAEYGLINHLHLVKLQR